MNARKTPSKPDQNILKSKLLLNRVVQFIFSILTNYNVFIYIYGDLIISSYIRSGTLYFLVQRTNEFIFSKQRIVYRSFSFYRQRARKIINHHLLGLDKAIPKRLFQPMG